MVVALLKCAMCKEQGAGGAGGNNGRWTNKTLVHSLSVIVSVTHNSQHKKQSIVIFGHVQQVPYALDYY